MEQRRFLLFIVLSLSFLIAWTKWGLPLFMPPQQQQNQVAEEEKKGPAEMGQAGDLPASVLRAPLPSEVMAKVEPPQVEEKPEAAPADEKAKVAIPEQGEPKLIKLGSTDPKSGYFVQHTITSLGAAVAKSELNDPRYRELDDHSKPLRVLGEIETEDSALVSFGTSVPAIDEKLNAAGKTTRELNWEVVETIPAKNSSVEGVLSAVTLRYKSPDGTFEVLKKYELKPGSPDPARAATEDERDSLPQGYLLHLTTTFKNVSTSAIKAQYIMQGPVGLPLENADNTRKFRDVRMGYFDEEEAPIPKEKRDITSKTKTSLQIVKDKDADEMETWNRGFHFIGIDCQYFAALLIPDDDQLKTRYFKEVTPDVLAKREEAAHSEIGLEFTSVDLEVPAGQEISQSYGIYIGPKRESLLDQLGIGGASEFGTFGMIAKPMVSFLNTIHKVIPSYGIAIIILTICVRGLMFPISRKQAIGAQKMKELQPKIAELKKKHKGDREAMGRAQMELFREHNYHPLSGCLPMVIQLPIFISLYQAFGNSVDLRMAPFLWIDNLAAPDALIPNVFGGKSIWPLGRDFNLLPIFTVVLFVVQQKMFMPKPDPSDEQAVIQYKMMNMMALVMGFFFYRMPAGLCVYFITSTLWGLAERKLLGTMKVGAGSPTPTDSGKDFEPPSPKKNAKQQPDASPSANGKKGFMARLMEVAEQAAEQSKLEKGKQAQQSGNRGGQKKKNKKKRR